MLRRLFAVRAERYSELHHKRRQPTWDLTPYQGNGIGRPNALWRLYELSGGVEYNRGRIDENGKLEGLPNQFKSNYTYDGYMELQQAAPMFVSTTFGAATSNGPKVNLCLNSIKG